MTWSKLAKKISEHWQRVLFLSVSFFTNLQQILILSKIGTMETITVDFQLNNRSHWSLCFPDDFRVNRSELIRLNSLKLFQHNVPFLCHLKTSENLWLILELKFVDNPLSSIHFQVPFRRFEGYTLSKLSDSCLKLFKTTLIDRDIFVNVSAQVMLNFPQQFPTNLYMDNMNLFKNTRGSTKQSRGI